MQPSPCPSSIPRPAGSRVGMRVLVLLVLGLLVSAGSLRGAARATNTAPATVTIPQSVFLDDPAGKDPFFPNSKRRITTPDSGKTNTVAAGIGALVLKGITGPPESRIALINNQTFKQDEEGEVRPLGGTAEQRMKIRCVEVREKSVVVTIGDQAEQHEIKLIERPLPKSD